MTVALVIIIIVLGGIAALAALLAASGLRVIRQYERGVVFASAACRSRSARPA